MQEPCEAWKTQGQRRERGDREWTREVTGFGGGKWPGKGLSAEEGKQTRRGGQAQRWGPSASKGRGGVQGCKWGLGRKRVHRLMWPPQAIYSAADSHPPCLTQSPVGDQVSPLQDLMRKLRDPQALDWEEGIMDPVETPQPLPCLQPDQGAPPFAGCSVKKSYWPLHRTHPAMWAVSNLVLCFPLKYDWHPRIVKHLWKACVWKRPK